MTSEEMERTMQFVRQQQAQFSTDIQQMNGVLATQSQLLSTQNQAIVAVVGMIGKLTEAQTHAEGRIATLETKMTELGTKMAALAEAGKETEDRLNAFIVFVEKYISSRNGERGTL